MNPGSIALLVAALVTLAVGLIFVGLVGSRSDETAEKRLERLSVSAHPLEDEELEKPFSERVLMPWLQRQIKGAGRLAPDRNIAKLRLKLVRAGHPGRLGVLDFMGVKILIGMCAGVGLLALFAVKGASLLAAVVFAGIIGVIGFMAPDFWLGSRVRKRQKQVLRNLPDALDMLTICVDAGAGLDSALLKISQKWKNAIATEFGKVVAEIRIGLTRREALQNMVERTDVADLSSFVAVLQQADQYGLSIATVLHNQSVQMRARRWQRAEEEARKVPTKLLFPLVFMIFPTMLVVTIGPAIPVLLRTFAALRK
jgi:tight adherence protein C